MKLLGNVIHAGPRRSLRATIQTSYDDLHQGAKFRRPHPRVVNRLFEKPKCGHRAMTSVLMADIDKTWRAPHGLCARNVGLVDALEERSICGM
jgi:hypothetical protein